MISVSMDPGRQLQVIKILCHANLTQPGALGPLRTSKRDVEELTALHGQVRVAHLRAYAVQRGRYNHLYAAPSFTVCSIILLYDSALLSSTDARLPLFPDHALLKTTSNFQISDAATPAKFPLQ